MSFTTPCYIHRNTIELRNKLRGLGYKVFPDIFNHPCLSVEGGLAIPADGYNRNGLYDCGTNPDLFLAIAALRDDSDYMQWFVLDCDNIWEAVGCYQHKGDFELCDRTKWYGSTDVPCAHKATVEELIEYFKNKEQP